MELTNTYKKEESKKFTAKNIFAIIATAVGLLQLLFLLLKGINYTNASYASYYSDGDMNMANLIFGGSVFRSGPNIGLLIAFIFMLIAIVLSIVVHFWTPAGYFGILLLITSSILWFCTVPLYGNMAASLGAAGICLGIFNLVDAVLLFLAVAYN